VIHFISLSQYRPAMTQPSEETDRKMHVVVVVLGDLGRSPRMQYHAASLLEEGHTVSLVGYEGVDLIPGLCNVEDRLNVIRFSVPSPEIFKKALPIYFVWRIVSLCLYLLRALFISVARAPNKKRVDCVLVQNPPAMPLLAMVQLYCLCSGIFKGHRPAMVIDWHNLGFTMLSNPVFSKMARVYERAMAPLATAHLCVTSAMKSFLESRFGVPGSKIHVLYDCPPQMFQPLSTADQHDLLKRLHGKFCAACPKTWHQNLNPAKQTLFTELTGDGKYIHRPGRPALVTSSTSWTPDEDFGQLLEAVVGLDKLIAERQSSLKVLVVITGKGPQKLYYQQEMSKLLLENVAIQTLWLEPVDYPRLLACTDLGVSLHTSTSGIDLPMKVLDLFGCCAPVCARNFHCLSELVEDDENGRIFDSSKELEQHLWYLLRPLDQNPGNWAPHSYGELGRYSQALKGRRRWSANWKENALPALLSATNTSR
jgi:beta-1,4-mannosyltransferase